MIVASNFVVSNNSFNWLGYREEFVEIFHRKWQKICLVSKEFFCRTSFMDEEGENNTDDSSVIVRYDEACQLMTLLLLLRG